MYFTKGDEIVDYRVWTPNEPLSAADRSVALGVFDGVHLGHRAVIAAARNVLPVSPNVLPTTTVFSITGIPKSGGKLLTEQQEREQAETLGVNEWLNVPFTAIRELTPAAFVHDILYTALGARVVCCGENYRFGNGGVGTAETLRKLCQPLGIDVRVIPTVRRDGEIVSSTAVRRALADGDPERAMLLLGRPYAVAFPVCAGNHLGAMLGFPTLNQPFPADYECPRFGVYASLVVIDGVQHRAITNVGVHPTVGNTAPQAETYVHGYHGDLYGKTVSVQLIRFLRAEQRFDTVEALKAQITADVAAANALLQGKDGAKAVLFDFDDTLQHRPQALLGVAHEMLQRHFPDLNDDERTARAETMLVENNHGYVDYIAFFDRLRERWGWSIPAADLLQEFQYRFPFYSNLFPDTLAVLTELKRRGYRIGIITNGANTQQNLKLDNAALRTYMDIVAVGGQEGVNKPDPEIFYRVAQRLCVAPENCLFVGDYPCNDIVGAQRAGMTPIYIDVFDRNDPLDNVTRITSLTQLLDIV